MLQHTLQLKDSLQFCTPRELIALSKSCSIFYTTEDSTHVIARAGDPITECFIIIKGTVNRYQNAAATEEDLERASSSNVFLEGFVDSSLSSSILGLSVLDNNFTWDSDYVARNGCYICSISVSELRRIVGYGGFKCRDTMICFWKFYKLWGYVFNKEKNEYYSADPLLGTPLSDELKINDLLEKKISPPIDVVSNARIKVFSSGQAIFSQGSMREYMVLILMGECIMCRKLPDFAEDIPLEVL